MMLYIPFLFIHAHNYKDFISDAIFISHALNINFTAHNYIFQNDINYIIIMIHIR